MRLAKEVQSLQLAFAIATDATVGAIATTTVHGKHCTLFRFCGELVFHQKALKFESVETERVNVLNVHLKGLQSNMRAC